MGGKVNHLFKTAQFLVHLIISLYVIVGNNLQHYKAFTSNRKRPSTVNKHCLNGQCCRTQQDSKFNCLVFVFVEKQRLGDTKFSGGKIILIGQFFAVGSPG